LKKEKKEGEQRRGEKRGRWRRRGSHYNVTDGSKENHDLEERKGEKGKKEGDEGDDLVPIFCYYNYFSLKTSGSRSRRGGGKKRMKKGT